VRERGRNICVIEGHNKTYWNPKTFLPEATDMNIYVVKDSNGYKMNYTFYMEHLRNAKVTKSSSSTINFTLSYAFLYAFCTFMFQHQTQWQYLFFLLWEKTVGLRFKAKIFQRGKPSIFLLATKMYKMQRLGIEYYPHHPFSVLLCASMITLVQKIANSTIPCIFIGTE
jgi:hypothetical protein